MADQAGLALSSGKPSREGIASLFLMLLLVGDLVYILVHLVWTQTSLLDSPLAALDVDRGYAEFFQYMKLLWAVLLLICLSLRRRQMGFLAWALLFSYLLVDDSFRVHERIGAMLADRLEFHDAFALRAVDFGELLVSATAGAVLALLLAWAYLRESDGFRQASRHLLMLLLVIVFFGVGVDMVHIALDPGGWVDNGLVILEDGGELVAMSFVTWYAFVLLVDGERAPGASLGSLVARTAAHGARAFRRRQ